MYGLVRFVGTTRAGGWTLSPIPVGVSEIPVNDAVDFDPAGGVLEVGAVEPY